MKRQEIKENFGDNNNFKYKNKREPLNNQYNHKKKMTARKTLISCFLIYFGWPLCLYLSFIYFNPILKETFGYSSGDIIKHNFFLSIISMSFSILITFLSYYVHPIRILKIMWIFTFFLMLSLPVLIVNVSSHFQIFFIQVLILLFPLQGIPADAIFLYHLPVFRRFTYASLLHAVARALMYIITSFGLVYLQKFFGHFGIWFITLPVTFAFLYAVLYFEGLERRMGMFGPNNPFYKTDLLKKSWFKA